MRGKREEDKLMHLISPLVAQRGVPRFTGRIAPVTVNLILSLTMPTPQ